MNFSFIMQLKKNRTVTLYLPNKLFISEIFEFKSNIGTLLESWRGFKIYSKNT